MSNRSRVSGLHVALQILNFAVHAVFQFRGIHSIDPPLTCRLDSEAAKIAIHGFPYFASGFVFFIVNIAVVGYFQSVERIKPATIFALLRGFVFLIPSFILLPKFLGVSGIWLAMHSRRL